MISLLFVSLFPFFFSLFSWGNFLGNFVFGGGSPEMSRLNIWHLPTVYQTNNLVKSPLQIPGYVPAPVPVLFSVLSFVGTSNFKTSTSYGFGCKSVCGFRRLNKILLLELGN